MKYIILILLYTPINSWGQNTDMTKLTPAQIKTYKMTLEAFLKQTNSTKGHTFQNGIKFINAASKDPNEIIYKMEIPAFYAKKSRKEIAQALLTIEQNAKAMWCDYSSDSNGNKKFLSQFGITYEYRFPNSHLTYDYHINWISCYKYKINSTSITKKSD